MEIAINLIDKSSEIIPIDISYGSNLESIYNIIKDSSEDLLSIEIKYPIYWNQMPYQIKRVFDEVFYKFDRTNSLSEISINQIVSLGTESNFLDQEHLFNLSELLHFKILRRLNTQGSFTVRYKNKEKIITIN